MSLPAIPDSRLVESFPWLFTPRKQILLLGGSFDPVHAGHIAMARAARDQLEADEVWFIPTRQTPLKDRELTDPKHRVRMLELALKDEPDFYIKSVELERQGESFTIDTMEEFHHQYPDCAFTWLIGADQLAQLHKWKKIDRLIHLVRFACFARDGQMPKTKYKVLQLDMCPVPVSSTDIRKGNRLNYLREDVLDYIYKNRLYCKQFVKERVTAHRYLHSLSVANLTEEFARANGLDPDRAWLAGMFHDVCKSMPPERMKPWMEVAAPHMLQEHTAAWHGFVGSEVCRRIFGIEDEQVLNAIYHHVHGSSTEPVAMAVYCADKLDPLRGYDSYGLINACKKDLADGFRQVKEENERYLARTLKQNGNG